MDKAEQEAFEELSSPRPPSLCNPTRQTFLTRNGCFQIHHRSGLSQLCKDDKWHPVGFTSKSLSDAKRNYEIHNKELLSVIWGLEEWKELDTQ